MEMLEGKGKGKMNWVRVKREIDSEKSPQLYYEPGNLEDHFYLQINQNKEISCRYSLKAEFLPKRQKLYSS